MHLVRMIDFWARQKPDAPAIMMLDQVTSYQALSRAIRSVAAHMARLGLEPNTSVGVLIAHPPRNLAVTFALMALGIPSIVVRDSEVGFLRAIGVRTLICEGSQGSLIPGIEIIQIQPEWFGHPNPPSPPRLGSSRRTKFAFTSGTTGIPKAIAFSDAEISARSNFLRMTTGDRPWMRMLCMPGLSTNYGFSQVALALEVGRTVSFAGSPEDIARMIELFGIDMLVCSSQQAQGVADHLASQKQRLRSLKCTWVGGSMLYESLAAKVKEYLSRDVVCVYGSTEAHVTAFARWDAMKHVPRAVGFVCPWATVECVDEAGAVVPAGQDGEIRIKAPARGANCGPAQDTENLDDTWFYPGDRGFLTADGLLAVTGRTRDMINQGGAKASAAIIDQCLAALPGIQDVAVCMVQRGADADELVALVVSKSPPELRTLNAALERARVEARIDRLVMVEGIPRTAVGKVNREDAARLARSSKG